MICLSVTRVQPLINIQINGYDFVNVKPKGKAGGVTVYINTYLKFTQINRFELHGAESVWLKVWHENQNKAFVIGTIYRHPNVNVHEFLDDFSECLETLKMKVNLLPTRRHQYRYKSKLYKACPGRKIFKCNRK